MKNLPLQSFRLQNFKAIRDSGTVEFTPLTVFIGNNGSGKSSFIEGLETYQAIIKHGLDVAMNHWRGFEYARNRVMPHELEETKKNQSYETNPLEFELRQTIKKKIFRSTLSVTLRNDGEVFIQKEKLLIIKKNPLRIERNEDNSIIFSGVEEKQFTKAGISILSETLKGAWTILPKRLPDTRYEDKKWLEYLNSSNLLWENFNWQFLTLNPDTMGIPMPQKRTGDEIQLNKDGSNIAEYLLSIRNLSPSTYDGILKLLQYVLPYAQDLQPVLTSELERAVYLQLTEKENKIPGWLLSTGTLRLVALLALLRHPNPPPVMVIEEIENGLDLRTVCLLVEEIRNAIEDGKTQIIATSHSPYFLDLLSLSQLVLVERGGDHGEPIFTRPANQQELAAWAERFAPGELYTMGKLHRQRR
jgi:predicted ATPase